MKKLLIHFTAFSFCFLMVGCAPPPPDISQLEVVPVAFDCDDSVMPAISDDPGDRGPWTVGARTVMINDLKTEIWYPALPNSEFGKSKKVYDLRQFLPARDAAKIPDNAGLDQPCDCYDDLAIDDRYGAYPVIVLIHGTASFRTASLPIVTHWASRGFVVVSADNPNIQLKDAKANLFGVTQANQPQDAVDVIEALQKAEGELSFLNNRIDYRRIGLSGHSAGGNAAGVLGFVPGVRVIVPMAAGGSDQGEYLNATMVIGSEKDGVVDYQRQQDGYGKSPNPKRLVGVSNTGHLVYTELCTLGAEQGGLIPLVESFGVSVPSFFRTLGTDGCGDNFLPSEEGWQLINYVSTAAFEEVLQCNARSADAFVGLAERFPQLHEFMQNNDG